MDIFSSLSALTARILVAVWTRVIARLRDSLKVVVVLLSAHHKLGALSHQRGWASVQSVRIPARKQVCGLSDRGDHLFCGLDRLVGAVVLHCHLEVGVHHGGVHVARSTHVDGA